MAPNLERAGRHYVAYDRDGFAFRCVRRGRADWRASPSHLAAATDLRGFTASRLRDVAAKVAASSREGR